MSGRAIVIEDINPYGVLPNWLSPQLESLGWEAVPIPTLQVVRLLGAEAYRHLLIKCVEEIQPHIVFVESPLDYLDVVTCETIRKLGAQLVAWFTSMPSELDNRKERIEQDLRLRFDKCFTPLQSQALLDVGVQPAKWVISPESVIIDDPAAPAHEAVLIAPYNEKLGEFVQHLAEQGVEIACYGQGWYFGAVSRVSRLGLYRRANFVIITKEQRLEMLEAFAVGAKVIVEDHTSLTSLLQVENKGAIFSSAIECASLIKGGYGRREPLRLFSVDDLWPCITEGIKIDEGGSEKLPSMSLQLIYSTVAHAYERVDNPRAAQIVFELWHRHAPQSVDAILGQARIAMSINFYENAATYAKKALELLSAMPQLESMMGYLDFINRQGDPIIEAWNIRLSALAESDQLMVAIDETNQMNDIILRAVEATLDFETMPNKGQELKLAFEREL
ncbi:tetratricopeptide repeat protein [Pseudoalteromonas peptidolytica]|uniref:hypothetical protein n=1 Tax=Pseudoalteromonas peptidolytica TaxID=61150 RepID=UPI00298E5C51|nr:hypothetical protein [Pseudoalteromonas peptidolytica]MDW7547735.1 hypothetical protein [Pseudoalteromonas peptidolytica]